MTRLAATDESLAARASRLGHLDELVRAAVPAEEAVPSALLERLGLAGSARSGGVVNLAEARCAQAGRRADTLARIAQPRRAFLRMAAQVAIVTGIGVSLAVWSLPGKEASAPRADYRTLSNAPDKAAQATNALVMFAPGTKTSEARAIAAAAGAQLMGEPNAAGAWKAAVAPERRDVVLQALRRDQRVSMAEPVDGMAR